MRKQVTSANLIIAALLLSAFMLVLLLPHAIGDTGNHRHGNLHSKAAPRAGSYGNIKIHGKTWGVFPPLVTSGGPLQLNHVPQNQVKTGGPEQPQHRGSQVASASHALITEANSKRPQGQNPFLGPDILIEKSASGLVSSDPLTNETRTQQELESDPGFWSFGGDAGAENASYAFWRDSMGLHIGIQPHGGDNNPIYAGFYAETQQANATLFHVAITAPARYLADGSAYYQANMIIAPTLQSSQNYISCFSDTGISGTVWAVALAGKGLKILWADDGQQQPLTQDCTLVTNGRNYLAVFLGGTEVYENRELALNMSAPFNVYLESESSYRGQMMNATFADYYSTSNDTVTIEGRAANATYATISTGSDGNISRSPFLSGEAVLNVGGSRYPLNGTITVYGAGNETLSSSRQEIFGGDAYRLFALPGAPQNLTLDSVNSSSATISWDPPLSNGGSPITGYEIERSGSESLQKASRNSTGPAYFSFGNGTTFDDISLDGGSTYIYIVFAKNLAGLGPPSYAINVTTPADLQSPSHLAANSTSPTEVSLSWQAPPEDDLRIQGYEIERSSDGAATWSTIVYDTRSNLTTFQDTGLEPQASYAYTVAAITPLGLSPKSNIAYATTQQSTVGSPTAVAGIVVPLYCAPYGRDSSSCPVNSTSTDCSKYPDDFCWQPIVDAHLSHPRVPLFVIINPDNGPCLSADNPCDYSQDYGNGIGNLTKNGITVLGYVRTRYADPASTPTCCPYREVQENLTQWSTLYGQKGVSGINLDEMSTRLGPNHTTLSYYENLTRYARNNLGFQNVFANPGIPTIPAYLNGHAADTINIYEGAGAPSLSMISSGTLADTSPVFGRTNFSLVAFCQPELPNSTVVGNYSNYVGYLYFTDVGSYCTAYDANPWDRISSYLSELAGELDKPASTLTINTVDQSGRPISGYYVGVTQSGHIIPSGYSPLPYLATAGVAYTFTPVGYAACSFDHWNDNLSGVASRTVRATAYNQQFTAVFSGPGCP
ncbi:MAG: fibronectin type III domain-containing protein [Thaumarchaeota archaeon]|nr:fibronectin type III domain-containing protein [Nitrososphaerota archaeon]